VTHHPVDIDRIRAAIRRCPDVGSSSWVVGQTVTTRSGEEIKSRSMYLADPDTAVLICEDREIRVSVVEITDVRSHLRSPGPE
jgi:hypothetical protein